MDMYGNTSYTEEVPPKYKLGYMDIAPQYTKVGTLCGSYVSSTCRKYVPYTHPLYMCRNIHCTVEGLHGQKHGNFLLNSESVYTCVVYIFSGLKLCGRVVTPLC